MLVLILALAALVVVGAAVASSRASGGTAARWTRWLLWAAAASAAVTAALLAPAVFEDSGWFAGVLLGVPVVLAVLPAGWEATVGRGTAAVSWVAGALSVVWALLLALGINLVFLPAALLLLGAAAIRTSAAGAGVTGAGTTDAGTTDAGTTGAGVADRG